MASHTTALRHLVKKSTEFQWLPTHEDEWRELKAKLTTAPVLAFFDPTKETKISTDASQDGIGAVLLQRDDSASWAPVEYASRAMTPTEQRYAQIEKECLGLLTGIVKFHNNVYGLPKFTVETDHMPLAHIIQKDLNDMTPRLQRILLKLRRYDFELVYTPGKELIIADALSRSITTPHEQSDFICHIEAQVQLCTSDLPASDNRVVQIDEETAKDPLLQRVMHHLSIVSSASQCPQFYNVKDDLTVVEGILLKLNRIVIPQSMRAMVLGQLHEGHLGVEKCRRRPREAVYWPGISQDIANTVLNCPTFHMFQPAQPKATLQQHEIVTSLWSKVGVDLFHAKGRDYILLVDYFPSYPEVMKLSNLTSKVVIEACKETFAKHGIPLTVMSNNGPCFYSQEWSDFAQSYNFRHVVSSPHCPQSNGKAEKGIHIVKQLLCKAADSGSDLNLAMLAYRTTPLSTGLSPAQMLMNRTLRATVPAIHVPDLDHLTVLQKVQQSWAQQKATYDAHATDLPELAPTDHVHIQLPEGSCTE
ncbi:hypothetical protein scyTo_0002237 [Scyliorhinus torazame]|uniref:Gypsy retrotransposon integrase-like protein 1 n=1 Tax=Scyliorhinus torazame TaxID=75743 RepID=A0A401PID3_SCYTO|nr:hypothetical protein [Scyliorhinus torazame]